MSLVVVVVALVKIIIMVGFLLNMAAIATWADRRQGAMVQDRVGPNRAVVTLPSIVVQALFVLPPGIFATFAGFAAVKGVPAAGVAESTLLALQASVFVTWFSLMVLCFVVRRKGAANGLDELVASWTPRSILVTGLAFHVVAFVVVSGMPAAQMPMASRVANGLLALIFACVGIYSAAKVPEGKVGIRLAGTLHAIADTIKMIWKEDFVPPKGDKILHSLAPILSVFPVLVTCAVIPFGRTLCFRDLNNNGFDFADIGSVMPAMGSTFQCPKGTAVPLQIADLNVGILYIFAMAGTGVIGAAIAGWASDNKWSLLGGLRAASQMVSYEVAMGISLISLLLIYGSVRLGPMVEWQSTHTWGIFVQPGAFVLFLVALLAETKRVPFDQPEGESEIVAGYFVEYSGMKWGMFMTGEYVEVITSSILLVTLFFGGYALPFLDPDGIRVAFGDNVLFTYKMNHVAVVVISAIAFFTKVIVMAWAQVFIRWTLPRFRYDQLMKLGWTRLLPLALGNMLVTAIVVLAVNGHADIEGALALVADVTQALIALGMLAAVLAFFFGIVEPVKRQKVLLSTAQKFAAAAGGVRMAPRQA
ncbi:MAG: NADH-quinone oxidoreductase subunit H [Polyangiaceae bacterium]|nr:NADH-quinone oxidoreductase subunit H [Polyangiaceae bacterium]